VPEPVSSSQPGHTGSVPPPQQNQYQAGGVGQQEGHHFQQHNEQDAHYDDVVTNMPWTEISGYDGVYTGEVILGIPNGQGSFTCSAFSLSGTWVEGFCATGNLHDQC